MQQIVVSFHQPGVKIDREGRRGVDIAYNMLRRWAGLSLDSRGRPWHRARVVGVSRDRRVGGEERARIRKVSGLRRVEWPRRRSRDDHLPVRSTAGCWWLGGRVRGERRRWRLSCRTVRTYLTSLHARNSIARWHWHRCSGKAPTVSKRHNRAFWLAVWVEYYR